VNAPQLARARPLSPGKPRIGFLGVGWIGLNRLQALADSGVAHVAAIADPEATCLASAARSAPDAYGCRGLEELLDRGLEGLVIATPSALHAEQSVQALERGIAVFCQKPLARTADEARAVLQAARRLDRPFGVDLSYRHVQAFQRLRSLARQGELGELYAADLVFHNAYGPDKPWFYDKHAAGGGCVMDLGIHLIDLARWLMGNGQIRSVRSHLYAGGEPLGTGAQRVEDYAVVELELGKAVVRMACSWGLPAGQDAVIEARLFGTGGGGAARNVNGSFYDFVAERYHGTRTEVLCRPPDAWGGRALVAWARALAAGARFDADEMGLIEVHEVIDRIYGRGLASP
jgi:predicted dehydrogenase